MKTIKAISPFIIIIGLIFFSTNIFSQGMPPMFNKMAEKLNLTDAQKQDFKKVNDEHFKTMIDLNSLLKKNEIDMKSAWTEEKLNKKDIEKLVDKIAEVKTNIAKEKINHWFNVYGKLDDNQKKEFKKMSHQFLQKMKMNKDKMNFPPRKGMGPKKGMGKGPCDGSGCRFLPEDKK